MADTAPPSPEVPRENRFSIGLTRMPRTVDGRYPPAVVIRGDDDTTDLLRVTYDEAAAVLLAAFAPHKARAIDQTEMALPRALSAVHAELQRRGFNPGVQSVQWVPIIQAALDAASAPGPSEAERDTARLAWLERNAVIFSGRGGDMVFDGRALQADIRQAIDATMTVAQAEGRTTPLAAADGLPDPRSLEAR